MNTVRAALDRSVREIDEDGHMRIGRNVIATAGTSEYVGNEVVDWQRLGLDPNKLYSLFRPPDEIERAAPSLHGKPLLISHRPVSAADHPFSLTVGSIINPRWNNPDLTAELIIWDKDAIDRILDGSERSLSAGYAYVPRMGNGSYQGLPYKITMTQIRYNHVTLCSVPRVASAMVGDSKAQKRKYNFAMDISSINDPEPRFPGPNDKEATFADVLDYLRDKISPEELKEVMRMFQSPTAMASDAASREIRARRRAAAYADFCARFPDAARIRSF
jgi:hypothetical protein